MSHVHFKQSDVDLAKSTDQKEKPPDFIFLGKEGEDCPDYPSWRYNKENDRRIVRDTAQDEAARKDGYLPLEIGMRMPTMRNVGLDFELMSKRQLILFAKTQLDFDLDPKLKEWKMCQVIWSLYSHEPAVADRIVLLAQSIKMNYDQTQQDTRDMIAGKFRNTKSQTFTKEFFA